MVKTSEDSDTGNLKQPGSESSSSWTNPPVQSGTVTFDETGPPSFPPVLSVVPVPSSEPAEDETQVQIEDGILPDHRFDRLPVKLETRGVTSHPVRPRQGLLFAREVIWQQSILAKLDEAHRNDLADKIRGCHTERSVRQCLGCKAHSIFWNRCEVKWCPVCAARLSRERRESVEWWTKTIKQPKHVVLTARNTDDLTRETITRFKAAFTRLRRSMFARNWQGGFYSLEVTNESRGWHLHLHALVDAGWIDSGMLAKTWARCIGQEFAIVKVKDCRNGDYLAEVTKYAVKGNELSTWSSPDIITFIEAFENVRTFGVFGSLYARRTEWKEFLDELRAGRVRCECGCDRWRVMSDHEFEWEEVTKDSTASMPPPKQVSDARTPELFNLTNYPR